MKATHIAPVGPEDRRKHMSIHLKTWQWVVLGLLLLFVIWLSLVIVP